MTHRIVLHVGTPKTGTSYLQDVLFNNRARLRRAGIHYPANRFDAHFLAALDLMQLPWGGLEQEAVGAWDRLATAARQANGTVIISHEILARAGRAHVERAMTTLGRDDGAEIQVVVSARDLMRQIPAEWQENVKHRASLSYSTFLRQIVDPERDSRIGSWFWSVQEIPDILQRWAGALPPENVQIITVPRPGADSGLLWQRFTEAFGLMGLDLELMTDRSNPSLGAAEAALIRRINLQVNAVLPPPEYRPLVRELLAHQTLSKRRDSPRLSVPAELRSWVREREEEWISSLRAAGYRVVGDLDDLRGADFLPDAMWSDPDHPDEAAVSDAAVAAISRLLTESAVAQREINRLHAEVDHAWREVERAHLRPTYRLRAKIVRRAQGSRVGRGALKAYRKLRRR